MSAAWKRQSGYSDWTISNPWPTASMQSRSSLSSISHDGGRARRSTISGSIRGSTRPASGQGMAASASATISTVLSYIGPQIGAWTAYSSQMVRLVKPIFQPTGFSPAAIRRRVISAETR